MFENSAEETLPNRAFPFTALMLGFWFLVLWFVTAGVLELSLGENPFLGWANTASRTATLVGLTWALLVVPFLSWVIIQVNAPPEIRVGTDYVQGVPPFTRGRMAIRRQVVVRFETLERVGWNLLGPAVQGSSSVSPGANMLLSLKNARLIRQRWIEWKRTHGAGKP